MIKKFKLFESTFFCVDLITVMFNFLRQRYKVYYAYKGTSIRFEKNKDSSFLYSEIYFKKQKDDIIVEFSNYRGGDSQKHRFIIDYIIDNIKKIVKIEHKHHERGVEYVIYDTIKIKLFDYDKVVAMFENLTYDDIIYYYDVNKFNI